MSPRLKVTYEKEILPKLMTKLNCSNKHQVPKINKVVLMRFLKKKNILLKTYLVCGKVCLSFSITF